MAAGRAMYRPVAHVVFVADLIEVDICRFTLIDVIGDG